MAPARSSPYSRHDTRGLEAALRILLVNDYAAPIGGAEIQMAALRDELRARGHEVALLTSDAADSAPWADITCLGTNGRWRSLLQLANPWATAALRRAIGKLRPDVVHVRVFLTQLSPLILPALRSVPAVYHAVWYRAICPTGTKLLPDGSTCRVSAGIPCLRHRCVPVQDYLPLLAQLRLTARWRRAFDATVANSEAVRSRLVEAGFGPVELIRNGIAPRDPRPPLDRPPAVAFAGRLVREKGADVLIRAFASVANTIPQARLVIAGDGPERGRLQALAHALGAADAVSFPGHLAREELERRLAGSWVQAVPSRWDEPFPNVALEAMMRGTAVVASRCGGVPEVVRDGASGLLVPPGDPDSLARALSELLTDQERAERMGTEGREIALERFSLSDTVDAFVALYHRVVRERAGAARGRAA